MKDKKVKIPIFGTNYVERARDCLNEFEESTKKCDGAKSIGLSSCVYENAEIALRENQIDVDGVTDLKTKAHELRGKFYDSCKCSEIPPLTIRKIEKIRAGITS